MTVNGVTLNYVEEGEGEPVVFVHGSISDHRVFEGQREAIAEDYQYIAYTRRYFGDQPWPDEGENSGDETHAADLIAFVEGLDRGPVHLVGWSGGGSLAILAALERPDLFRSMVLYETGGYVAGQLMTTEAGQAANQEFRDAMAPADDAAAAGNLDQAVELFIDASQQTRCLRRTHRGSAGGAPCERAHIGARGAGPDNPRRLVREWQNWTYRPWPSWRANLALVSRWSPIRSSSAYPTQRRSCFLACAMVRRWRPPRR